MNNIIQVVRRDLEDKIEGTDISPKILESIPMYIRRAMVSLHNDGALPPRIFEFKAGDKIEEKRDGNGNLLYNFIFLPEDFLRLDKFTVYNVDKEDNREEMIYQRVSSDMLFDKRGEGDKRNFFAIVDYHLEDERTRKILVLDPFPDDNDYLEVRYFADGTVTPLENLNQRYWEPIISKVHHLIGLKSAAQAEKEISKESANWRNQEGKDSYNKTHNRTSVKFPFGKTR